MKRFLFTLAGTLGLAISAGATQHAAPERWLKGPGGRAPLTFCALSDQSSFMVGTKTGVRGPERSECGRRVVVFMSAPADQPVAGEGTALGALQRTCRWVTGVVSISPYDDIPAVSPADSAFVVEVERGLSRQSSTALSRRADLIVLARVPEGGATPGGTHVDIVVRRTRRSSGAGPRSGSWRAAQAEAMRRSS